MVSHDRDFLDGLVSKVYEFGGGRVVEHLGGIYDFLQKKQLETLSELQRTPSLSASSTTASATPSSLANAADAPSAGKLSYEEQKELNKRIKKAERRVAECEQCITDTEAAIAIIEEQMATPEGASDMALYEKHRKLKEQLDQTMTEWEAASMELESLK